MRSIEKEEQDMELNINEMRIIKRAVELEWDRKDTIAEKAMTGYREGRVSGTDAIVARQKADEVLELLKKVEEELKKLREEEQA